MFTLKNWLKSDTRPTNLYFFGDGGIRLEPPAASSAVVIKDEGGQIVDWFTQVLPPLTSMEAEYHGLLAALELARRWRPMRAYFHYSSSGNRWIDTFVRHRILGEFLGGWPSGNAIPTPRFEPSLFQR